MMVSQIFFKYFIIQSHSWVGGVHLVFIKDYVFILTCVNFNHIHSALHVMQYTSQDVFPVLKTVFQLIDFDVF